MRSRLMRHYIIFVHCLLLLSCSNNDDVTQILLEIHFSSGYQADQLQLSAEIQDTRTLPTIRRPEQALPTPLTDPQTVYLILPNDAVGKQFIITIEALNQGKTIDRSTQMVVPVAGRTMKVEVWFGLTSLDAGIDGPFPNDARLDAPRDAGQDVILDRDGETSKDANLDGISCIPNNFIRCEGASLVKCNNQGTGTIKQDCAPFACNSTAQRCNECDPEKPPTCIDTKLVTCSAEGLTNSTVCSLGCANGACCLDSDKDNFTTCAGDCDDQDPNVHPGQQEYFITVSKGTKNYDYDCNTIEEKENDQLENCVRSGSICLGHGWQNSVPACGVSGTFVNCKYSGSGANPTCSPDPIQAIQGCH